MSKASAIARSYELHHGVSGAAAGRFDTRRAPADDPRVAKHIGIVAVSPEGAAVFYQKLHRHLADSMATKLHPRLSMHNEPLAKYIEALNAGDWHEIGVMLRRSADVLAKCGAQFCLSPDNAIQHGIHLAEVGSPIPWLTMTDLVTQAVLRDGRKTVGLIGTKAVTSGSAYQTILGLRGVRVLAPDQRDADELNRIIFEELIFGVVKPASRAKVLDIIKALAGQGCEGVILGSSEAPLLITPENSCLPVYDSVDLLANGAARACVA
jgi:aspartate racemase